VTVCAAALLGMALVALPLGMSSSRAQQPTPPLPPAPYAVPAPVDSVAAPSLYNWSGFYLGVHGVWGFGTSNGMSHPTNTSGDLHVSTQQVDSDGIIGGGQIGFNWMASPNLVLGIETDVSGADIKGTAVGVSTGGVSYQKLSFDRVGTVRGRIGYPIDNWLIYVTGGFAWGHSNVTHIQGACFPSCGTVAFGATSHIAQNLTGWTAGAGAEVGLTSNWAAKLEYLHTEFGTDAYLDPTFHRSIALQTTIDVVRVGVNYKFW